VKFLPNRRGAYRSFDRRALAFKEIKYAGP
jgi:hypothetical protein